MKEQHYPYILEPNNLDFPPLEKALKEPNGLLAIGGDLSAQRLLNAYSQGVFPWFGYGEPIMWWSPDPRSVIFPEQYKPSKSLKKLMRKEKYEFKHNHQFNTVINACANIPRREQLGTWITDEMIFAYNKLHEMGFAHAFECYYDDKLVGGLYGIALGRVFFGESMFSTMSNTSKMAFAYAVNWLIERNFSLIDCQVESEHMNSLGAKNISRAQFYTLLQELLV